MKMGIIILTVTLLITAGCSKNAWYQGGKTLSEADYDCQQCKYEVMKYNNPYARPQTSMGYMVGTDTEMLMQCMRLKGYGWVNVTDYVKNGSLRVKGNGFDPWYTVAGD